MTASKIIALGFFIVALLIFLGVGLDLVTSTKYNLVAVGLAAYVGGFILDKYVP